jgi:hypothetical protein
MANKKNDRRKGEKRTEHGSRWENGENDRNSSRARKKWKLRANRSERRTGTVTPKFSSMTGGHQHPRRHTDKGKTE